MKLLSLLIGRHPFPFFAPYTSNPPPFPCCQQGPFISATFPRRPLLSLILLYITWWLQFFKKRLKFSEHLDPAVPATICLDSPSLSFSHWSRKCSSTSILVRKVKVDGCHTCSYLRRLTTIIPSWWRSFWLHTASIARLLNSSFWDDSSQSTYASALQLGLSELHFVVLLLPAQGSFEHYNDRSRCSLHKRIMGIHGFGGITISSLDINNFI